MLAISTHACPRDLPLADAVESLRDLGLDAIALHRGPQAGEIAALARVARRARIVAVFGEPCAELSCRLVVVEGGAVTGDDREASLEELCRRLHAFRDYSVAVRPPPDENHHPLAHEIPLLTAAVRHVGYWHEPARAGDDYLDQAAPYLLGASFHPRAGVDLAGLRDALPASAPAVIACPEGTDPRELQEAVRFARRVFRA